MGPPDMPASALGPAADPTGLGTPAALRPAEDIRGSAPPLLSPPAGGLFWTGR